MLSKNVKIAIVGLGYVGLPLAVEFGKKFKTIGFDINTKRILELNSKVDRTLEVTSSELELVNVNSIDKLEQKGKGLFYTSILSEIRDANIYIITVPTPIDESNKPDLNPIFSATKMVASILNKDDIVIYESTVYPGCVEEECVPILEAISNLKFNSTFFCGYSPERINPGDKINTLTKIKKITSGSTSEIANIVNELYLSIIEAGTHLAPSIKVAEAAKVIENAQRDMNIAFVNELAKIFGELDIDVNDVIEAAGTKWNFIKYKPGLVGGHCISVDPYYLVHKAQQAGVSANLISTAREINESMPSYIVKKIKSKLVEKSINQKESCLILGVTFKENCPDIRNSKSVDLYFELMKNGFEVDLYDTNADPVEVKEEFNIQLIDKITKKYSIIILAVSHAEFANLNISQLKANENAIVYDIKSFLNRKDVTIRL